MIQDVVIDLITVTSRKNENDVPVASESAVTVFAQMRDAGQAEFWAAMQNSVALTAVFEMWAAEYSGQRLVRMGDALYRVQRTYRKNVDRIELHCSSEVT